MKNVNPQKYDSIYDFLVDCGFTASDGAFHKDDIHFSVDEIIRHTPRTFAEKALRKGWLAETHLSSKNFHLPLIQ